MNDVLDRIDRPDRTDRPTIAPRALADFEGHRRFWRRGNDAAPPQADELLLPVPDAVVDELDRLLRTTSAVSMSPDAGRDAMPQTTGFAGEVRARLDSAPGAVILDRFPVERYDAATVRRLCGLFSSTLSPLLAQDHAGTELYDVIDKQVSDVGSVRRSITNLDQRYHTDGGWYAEPARYVGLFCVRNARQGGHSRVTSLLDAWRALDDADRRDVLDVLEQSQPWDRQGEHAPGEREWTSEPIVVNDAQGFLARYYESYVRSGYGKYDAEVPPSVSVALDAFSAALDAQSCIRFLLTGGQYQLVNNYTVVHAREAFDDGGASPGEGRHLIRVWHR